MDIHELMKLAADKKASDIHLSVAEPPILRIHGDLQRLEGTPFSTPELETFLNPIMSDRIRNEFATNLEVDFSFDAENIARFRVNVYRQNRGLSAALRLIPHQVPTFAELGLSEIFKKFCAYPNGVIFVTGPTGSGKSTTLAAMINYINADSGVKDHIITIEDPIEFVYSNKNCLIDQREVNKDTKSFNNALRSALREDPDIILVGEMRDVESIRLALTAAETGHLVFTTVHTNSAPKTIDRIVGAFDATEGQMIRMMLAESLRAVVSQTLLKRKDGSGRIAAQEILVANPAVRNLIREQKVAQLSSVMQTNREEGMRTLQQHIEELQAQGLIDK